MERDIKDVVGVLMRVVGGSEVSHEDLDDVVFEADGELEEALNEAYVKLRTFANDRDLRRNDPKLDHDMRAALQECLDNIVRVCDRTSGAAARDPSSSAA